MEPRPLEIFQKSSPSVCFCTASDVQLAGLGGGSAAAAVPSPLPLAPWQEAQFVSTDFLAPPTPLTGFFVTLASAGAVHGPWADTTATPAPATRAAAVTAAVSDFANALMRPPLRLLIVTTFTTKSWPFNTRETNEVKPIFAPRPRAAP